MYDCCTVPSIPKTETREKIRGKCSGTRRIPILHAEDTTQTRKRVVISCHWGAASSFGVKVLDTHVFAAVDMTVFRTCAMAAAKLSGLSTRTPSSSGNCKMFQKDRHMHKRGTSGVHVCPSVIRKYVHNDTPQQQRSIEFRIPFRSPCGVRSLAPNKRGETRGNTGEG